MQRSFQRVRFFVKLAMERGVPTKPHGPGDIAIFIAALKAASRKSMSTKTYNLLPS
jgi:hypothetical protein